VNAQFHLNTSVAPPFNAEARIDNPAGGFDDPWRGTGNETFFPFTTGPNSVFPLTGPYISIPSDIRVPRQQAWNVSLQRQIGDNLAAWTLSGIARFFSGRRLNIILTSDPARTGIANQRPNLMLDNPYADKSYTNYLNRASGDDQQLTDREFQQRPVRKDYCGRRPADHAVRDQVFVLTCPAQGSGRVRLPRSPELRPRLAVS
jgi:hypothetical protein